MNDDIKKEDTKFLKDFIKSIDEDNKVFKLSSELINIKENFNKEKEKINIINEKK